MAAVAVSLRGFAGALRRLQSQSSLAGHVLFDWLLQPRRPIPALGVASTTVRAHPYEMMNLAINTLGEAT